MTAITDEVMVEIADNWPAFVYITLMCVSSVVFLRERRAEARILKQASVNIQDQIRRRFDRLECMIREAKASDGAQVLNVHQIVGFGRTGVGSRETAVCATCVADDFADHEQRLTGSSTRN